MFDWNKQTEFLFKTAVNNKVYETLLKGKDSTSENKLICIENAVKILSEDCFIKDDKAIEIVSWLARVVYTNEWKIFKNDLYIKAKQQNPTNDTYIRQLQIEIESLKKQLEEKTKNNETEELSMRASERGVAIQTTNSLDNKNWTLEDIGLEMVYCPAGSFMMGSPNNELGKSNDEIYHNVIISKPFKIGKFPITQYQYKKIIGNNPSKFKGDYNPVESVSWNDAKEFCNMLNSLYKSKLPNGYKFDLPTEAQWEYACRAGTTTSLNSGKNVTSEYGKCNNLNEVGWYKENSSSKTHPIGQKKPNAWGIYDMHGNVWEWCKDWYSDYPTSSVTDPTGATSGSYRVLRGGSWNYYARFCRSAFRRDCKPVGGDYDFGFRIALVLSDKKDNNSSNKTRHTNNSKNSSNKDGCFITTAVCDSFNKPDDCYELTMFRHFCDAFLVDEPDLLVIAVADGHGSEPLSQYGSSFAVESACRNIANFVKELKENDLIKSFDFLSKSLYCGVNPKVKNNKIETSKSLILDNSGYRKVIEDANITEDSLNESKTVDDFFNSLSKLEKYIVYDWCTKVDEDFNNRKEKEPEKLKEYNLKKEDYKNPYHLYGTTLLVTVLTDDYWFAIQIGDGTCLALFDDNADDSEFKPINMPIPDDERCYNNVTTSLCDSDSYLEFRHCLGTKLPKAIFLGSDGIENSFSDGNREQELDGLRSFYISLIKEFSNNTNDENKELLEEKLKYLTEEFSGDDVSIAGLISNSWLKKQRVKEKTVVSTENVKKF